MWINKLEIDNLRDSERRLKVEAQELRGEVDNLKSQLKEAKLQAKIAYMYANDDEAVNEILEAAKKPKSNISSKAWLVQEYERKCNLMRQGGLGSSSYTQGAIGVSSLLSGLIGR